MKLPTLTKDIAAQIDREFKISDNDEFNGVVTKYTGKERIVTLPEGVCAIGDYAFAGTYVEVVVCSSTLEDIGDSAFQDCLKLKEIHLNQKLKHMGRAPFSNCPNLEKIIYNGTKDDYEKILKGEPFGSKKIIF